MPGRDAAEIAGELADRLAAITTTVNDLVAKLEQIDELAVATQRKLRDGAATTGASGLTRIHEFASDAVAEARERLEGGR